MHIFWAKFIVAPSNLVILYLANSETKLSNSSSFEFYWYWWHHSASKSIFKVSIEKIPKKVSHLYSILSNPSKNIYFSSSTRWNKPNIFSKIWKNFYNNAVIEPFWPSNFYYVMNYLFIHLTFLFGFEKIYYTSYFAWVSKKTSKKTKFCNTVVTLRLPKIT